MRGSTCGEDNCSVGRGSPALIPKALSIVGSCHWPSKVIALADVLVYGRVSLAPGTEEAV